MTKEKKTLAISKELSANDTGATGGHQSGMMIPKDPQILSFFPPLDKKTKNPRHHLVFYEEDETRWEFAFIYYNNIYFGGTRNEYRLTRMTPFINQHGLEPGDSVILSRNPDTGRQYITCQRARPLQRTTAGHLKLGSSWKTIKIGKR